MNEINGRQIARLGTLVIIAILAISFLSLLNAGWRTIRPGYVGIVFDKITHKVTSQAREPGWTIINPFTQSIQEYPVTIQTYAMVQKSNEGQTAGDDSIKVQSSEGQQLNLDVVIQYQVKRDEAGTLYEDWGGQDITFVEDRVVRQYTRSQVPVISAQYTWEEITAEKRAEVISKISKTLEEEFARRHLQLVSFGIREVHLPDVLQQQQAEQQKYQLEQAKVKAEQDRVEAEGRANALKAQAAGEAQATLVRAQAQAEANQVLAKSLTPELIRYQQLQRWDGRLPVFAGSNATPLINASDIISGTSLR